MSVPVRKRFQLFACFFGGRNSIFARPVRGCLVAIWAILFLTAALQGQQMAQLTGRITDSGGAAIPGATVTVTNAARGIRDTATTGSTGYYVVPLLPPASDYELAVSANGFQTLKRAGITLQVAQVAQVDLVLSVGATTETVTVTGAPPLLDTQTSSVGQTITANTVSSLPLNGRSSFRLIQLTPGVTFTQAASGQFGDVPVNTQQDSDFNINGGRADANEVLIDGVPSTAGFYNAITTIPSVDDTQEFKVESDNLSAQYGRFGGGVLNVTTKSGTNELHGTVFEFLRNNVLNADDYIDRGAGNPTPPFKMNQFGAAVGGPVVLPHLYHGRDKTFFFADFQGTRRVQGSVYQTTVPTALQRQGDFSQTYNSAGKLVTIYNPFSTMKDPNNPGQYIRTAFSGNSIAGMIDPVAKAILNYYPMPNQPGAAYTNANNYISNAPVVVDVNQGSVRIDQNVNSRYRLFGRFAWTPTDLIQPNYYGTVASPGAGATGNTIFHNWSFALNNTVIISPTELLTINYGWARWFQTRQTLSYGFNNSSLGFPASFVSSITVPMFPQVNITGYGGTSGQTFLRTAGDSHSLLISLTSIHGRHTLVMGSDVRLHLINNLNVPVASGTFSFTQAQTQGPNPNTASSTAGNALASFMLGAGNSGSFPVGSGNELRDWYAAGYLQDTIRVSDKLTLNAGVRYEEESPYTDRHNELNYFSSGISSPAANPTFPNLTGGLVFAGAHGASTDVYQWNTNQFAPRVGFAYTPISNTAIHAGFGIVYAPLELDDSATGFAPNTGYSSSTSWNTSQNGGLNPYDVLSNPYPQGIVQPSGNSLGAATALGQSLLVWDAEPKNPVTYQWNFGIQRQLPSSMTVEGTYIGTRGLHLTDPLSLDTLNPSYLSMGTALQTKVTNPFQPYVGIGTLSAATVTQQQLLLPYPQFLGITEENATWGDSNYQSGQFKVTKQTTHGISFLAVYTISKWLSDVNASTSSFGTINNTTSVQNPYNLRAEKSLSEIDIPQAFIFNAVVELPFGRGRTYLNNTNRFVDTVLGGWNVSPIVTLQKGVPLALSAPITDGGNRPNYVAGVSPVLPSNRPIAQKVKEWFNPAAFALPPAFSFGNVSRTIGSVRSPALKNLDISFDKETQLVERLRLQFRCDIFNFTNTAHFSSPDSNMSDLTFGQLTTLDMSPPPREIQFAAKFVF